MSASARIDSPSTRLSRRIGANCSTLDPTLQPPLLLPAIRAIRTLITVRWGQFKPSQPLQRVAKVGPNHTVTTTPRRHTGGAISSRPPGANSGCHSDRRRVGRRTSPMWRTRCLGVMSIPACADTSTSRARRRCCATRSRSARCGLNREAEGSRGPTSSRERSGVALSPSMG